MKTREQFYNREMEEILRDITSYHCILRYQIYRLYPYKKPDVIDGMLDHLVRQRRIVYDKARDMYLDSIGSSSDIGTLTALWVLAEFADEAEYHSPADFPIKLMFFSNGETYEVIFVPSGNEGLIEQALALFEKECGRRIVIVEDAAQIQRLNIKNAAAYCTVSGTGEIKYYKKE